MFTQFSMNSHPIPFTFQLRRIIWRFTAKKHNSNNNKNHFPMIFTICQKSLFQSIHFANSVPISSAFSECERKFRWCGFSRIITLPLIFFIFCFSRKMIFHLFPSEILLTSAILVKVYDGKFSTHGVGNFWCHVTSRDEKMHWADLKMTGFSCII